MIRRRQLLSRETFFDAINDNIHPDDLSDPMHFFWWKISPNKRGNRSFIKIGFGISPMRSTPAALSEMVKQLNNILDGSIS